MKKISYKYFIGFCAALMLSSQAGAQSQCANQVPVHTYNPGAVTTSGNFDNGYAGWFAFDGSYSSMWISNTYQNSAWIAYQFSINKRVDRYSIHFSNGSLTSRAPRDFQLQALSNGTWITLDNRTNQNNWLGNEKRTFTVSQPGSYSHYRLFITNDNDDSAAIVAVSIGELALESCGCDSSVELVPALSTNTSAVSVSGVFSSAYPGWKAFDNSMSSMWLSAQGQTPASIGYEWTTPRFVDSYALTYANGSITSRAPKNWQLQGWNGASWTTVDSRPNETNWSGFQTRQYTVQTPGSYSKYRLVIADDNAIGAGIVVISLGNLSLKGCEMNTFTAASLQGDWHEDNAQSGTDFQHYVPTSVDLGASRFREAISFYAGGAGRIYRLAPNDGHYYVNTTWTLNGKQVTVTFTDNKWSTTAGTYDYVYEVVSASTGNLRLKVISKTKR
ncbi:MAG: discoidin domain-containing protein [Pseudomonadota bacterium]